MPGSTVAITQHFTLDQTLDARDMCGDVAETEALMVIINA